MRSVVEHRCPQCEHVVSSTTRRLATVGRPFEECPCGAYVTRTPYEEWTLMKRSTRTRILLSSATLAVAVGLAPGAALCTSAWLAQRSLEVPLAVCGVGLALGLGYWAIWIARVVGPSRRRMRDPWYQAKLAQFAIQSARRGT